MSKVGYNILYIINEIKKTVQLYWTFGKVDILKVPNTIEKLDETVVARLLHKFFNFDKDFANFVSRNNLIEKEVLREVRIRTLDTSPKSYLTQIVVTSYFLNKK